MMSSMYCAGYESLGRSQIWCRTPQCCAIAFACTSLWGCGEHTTFVSSKLWLPNVSEVSFQQTCWAKPLDAGLPAEESQ
jgi:hypothetical protein